MSYQQHDPTRQTDAYGNPIQQTDAYGNPIHHTGTTGAHGTGVPGTHGPGMTGVGLQHGQQQGHGQGILHRSGSSSSSSSEDDGQGGRRKKGIKEKIKEKMPGGGHKEQQQQYDTIAPGGYGGTHGTATGTYGTEQPHPQEKKGVMEKIKEKLPGGH